MADQLFKIRQQERESKISKERKLRADSWLIVCEGKATEPNYFNKLSDFANSISENPIKFKVIGTGRNTDSLVESIDDFFDFADDNVRAMKIPFGKTFAVFDKDSFKSGQFNGAIHKAIRKGYIPIWLIMLINYQKYLIENMVLVIQNQEKIFSIYYILLHN